MELVQPMPIGFFYREGKFYCWRYMEGFPAVSRMGDKDLRDIMVFARVAVDSDSHIGVYDFFATEPLG